MGSVTTFEFVGGGIVSVCRLPVKLLFPLFTRTNSENRRRSVTIFTRGGGGGGCNIRRFTYGSVHCRPTRFVVRLRLKSEVYDG